MLDSRWRWTRPVFVSRSGSSVNSRPDVRICYVTPEYPTASRPDLGRPLYEVCQRLDAPTLIQTFAVPDPARPPAHAALDLIPFRDVTLADRRGVSLRIAMTRKALSYGQFFARGAAALRRFAPTIVHLETPMPFWHGVYARHRLGARLSMSFIGSDFLRLERSRALHAVVRQAHVLLPVSPHMVSTLARIAPNAHIVLTPYGVDRSIFRPLALPRLRQLLAPAAFRWEKAHDVLIEAFARVVTRQPDLRLVLAGDGERGAVVREDLRARGLEHLVTFAGHVTPSALATLYNESLLTVLASRSEGSPRVLTESMACGTPFVASDVGGCARLAEGTGVVTPPGDAQALADAICRLVADESAWSTLASECLARADAYDLDGRAARFREAFFQR